MTAISRESAQAGPFILFMAAVLAASGLLMTIYSAAILTGCIVRWLTRAY